MPVPQHDPHADSPAASVSDILKRHNAKLKIAGVKGGSYKEMAEDLVGELEAARHKTAAVASNLSAILNQYQVTSAAVKNLQTTQDRMLAQAQQHLLDLDVKADDTDTQSK